MWRTISLDLVAFLLTLVAFWLNFGEFWLNLIAFWLTVFVVRVIFGAWRILRDERLRQERQPFVDKVKRTYLSGFLEKDDD